MVKPKVGNHVWFLGDWEELQGELVITRVRKKDKTIGVKPIGNKDSSFEGWKVGWEDITYKEPLPEESYLYS